MDWVMGLSFELRLRAEGQADQVVCGQFSDGEYAMLQAYLQQYDEFAASKPGREGLPCHLGIKARQGEPVVVETELPDRDTLSILLHRLRPFILKNEPASFESVAAMIGKVVPNIHIRRLLREERRLYDGRQSQELMRLQANDVTLNSERVLYDWLNSHEYHRDPDKRGAIEALFSGLPGDLARAVLVSRLIDKANAIGHLAQLVKLLTTKDQKLAFTVPAPDGS
jgi:hypothetical protein